EAEQRAAGAVDVDVLVGVHDPFGRAGSVGGDAARVQVAQAESERSLRSAGGLVLVGCVGAAQCRGGGVDHVEFGGGGAFGNGACALAARQGGRLGVGEGEGKAQAGLDGPVVEERHADRLGGDAGGEGQGL